MPSESTGKKPNAKPKPNENQGEGNRKAAKDYNESQREFIKSGKVKDAANKAKQAVDGPKGDALKKAENKGKRPAAGR